MSFKEKVIEERLRACIRNTERYITENAINAALFELRAAMAATDTSLQEAEKDPRYVIVDTQSGKPIAAVLTPEAANALVADNFRWKIRFPRKAWPRPAATRCHCGGAATQIEPDGNRYYCESCGLNIICYTGFDDPTWS